MSAIKCLLADLFDYAGLFPPTSLDMHTALRNYLEYSHGFRQWALGRFVVELGCFPYLSYAAGDYINGMRLSLIASPDSDWSELHRLLDKGYRIEAIDIKPAAPAEILQTAERIPDGLATYFEVPWNTQSAQVLEAIAAVGARAKVRMGGSQAEDIPPAYAVVNMLKDLRDRRLSFKATAGLHHPIRSSHPLTSTPNSPITTMHGFINLACAAALIYFGDGQEESLRLLDEEDSGAWHIAHDSIAWRSYHWSARQLDTVRHAFLISIGSCSFTELSHDLEALGWL
jgi:hypothetical protein